MRGRVSERADDIVGCIVAHLNEYFFSVSGNEVDCVHHSAWRDRLEKRVVTQVAWVRVADLSGQDVDSFRR